MDPHQLVLLTGGVLLVAFLYSSVGHAGASGYIAIMALLNLAPEEIKPTALVLNIFVASITCRQFRRAGFFSWSLFWPFAILSVPLAFAGGYVRLPAYGFKVLVGTVLVASAVRLLLKPSDEAEVHAPRKATAVAVGAGLGLLAGLTGTGGGIFLTPVLVFMKWARIKAAGAASAAFILVNSAAGLAGNMASTRKLPGFTWFLVAAVVAGGAGGSYLGSRRFDPTVIKRLLAVVLAIAGFKLVFG